MYSVAPGMTVVQLEYEAYTAMAVKQMMQICRSVREKWPVCKIAIVHRTGYVIQSEGDLFGPTSYLKYLLEKSSQ